MLIEITREQAETILEECRQTLESRLLGTCGDIEELEYLPTDLFDDEGEQGERNIVVLQSIICIVRNVIKAHPE